MSNTTIYVGNAPYSATEEDFKKLFAPRQVVRVTIVTDRDTGRPRGFSFVEFASESDAASAVSELDGVDFSGRSLKISIARPKTGGGGGSKERGGDRGGRRRERDRYDD